MRTVVTQTRPPHPPSPKHRLMGLWGRNICACVWWRLALQFIIFYASSSFSSFKAGSTAFVFISKCGNKTYSIKKGPVNRDLADWNRWSRWDLREELLLLGLDRVALYYFIFLFVWYSSSRFICMSKLAALESWRKKDEDCERRKKRSCRREDVHQRGLSNRTEAFFFFFFISFWFVGCQWDQSFSFEEKGS